MRSFTFKIFAMICVVSLFGHAWDGPQSGPKAQTGKKVMFIASDLKNGGVIGVKNGLLEAVRELKWDVEIMDASGSVEEMQKILREAVKANVDGIVLGGYHPDSSLKKTLSKSRSVIVGWHAGPLPKHSNLMFANVTTDPAEVAKLAVESMQKIGHKNPGVIILTDKQFAIAGEKVRFITEEIKKCDVCKLLSVENVAISRAQYDVPSLVSHLNKKYGKEWTHTIAINDIYFDNMNFPLKDIGRTDITNIAAGDGSSVAFGRIKGGGSQQAMSVAEPLNAQGWQVADELNRAFAGKKESGYVSKPLAVTKEFLEKNQSEDVSAQLHYREAYLKIWKGL